MMRIPARNEMCSESTLGRGGLLTGMYKNEWYGAALEDGRCELCILNLFWKAKSFASWVENGIVFSLCLFKSLPPLIYLRSSGIRRKNSYESNVSVKWIQQNCCIEKNRHHNGNKSVTCRFNELMFKLTKRRGCILVSKTVDQRYSRDTNYPRQYENS